jgi:hypothetical protein
MQRLLLAAVLALFASASARAEDAPRELAFDVFRKGEPIGSHVIKFERGASGELAVSIDIRLEVKLLFVTVFRYEHRNHEVWRDGRLQRIETRTNDDGKDFFVKGALGPQGFAVESSSGTYVAPRDVISTSWWNVETINRHELLNSQRGELMAVTIAPAGEERVETAAGAIPARHYLVEGEAKLEVWYDRDDRLAKIRFAGSDGAPIEYRRRD